MNFLRAVLRKAATHTCTTARAVNGGNSGPSLIHLIPSSVSFKFKFARCPTRNVPNKVQMSLMVVNSLDVAERSRSIGCKKPCFEEQYVAKFLRFSSYCYNSHLRASCNAEFTRKIYNAEFHLSSHSIAHASKCVACGALHH